VEHYAGLDVSLELTSVCIVDAQGGIVCETKVASEPETLIRLLSDQELEIVRVGLEAGPLSQWLHAGLITAGFDAVLLETRHVKAALSAMTVKTDRRMRGASPSCCGSAGTDPCTPSLQARRRSERCSPRASSFRASCSISRAASAGCCAGSA